MCSQSNKESNCNALILNQVSKQAVLTRSLVFIHVLIRETSAFIYILNSLVVKEHGNNVFTNNKVSF